MSRPAPRSSKRSSATKTASASPLRLVRRTSNALRGKAAVAAYCIAVAGAAVHYIPGLHAARDSARQHAEHWVVQQPWARTALLRWADARAQWVGWRAALEDIAHQSRASAHTQASGRPTASANTPHRPPAASDNFSQCAEQLPAKAPLSLASVGAAWMPVALCSDGFAVLYSGLSKTPIVTIERLNRQRLLGAATQERADRFYADARLRATYKADLADYQGSGYDRGHMAAAANQNTETGMAQSFALSNMVPQDPDNNRKTWSKLESDVRKYAKRAPGNVYVYTGPLFESNAPTIGRNQVWVPSHLYKLVYDEQQQRAWAWVLPNTASAQLGPPMSYASFVERTGRNFLPQLH